MGVFQIVTAPTAEPVTLEELLRHLRVEAGVDDTLVTSLGKAARQYVETETGVYLVTRTIDWKRNGFPQELREREDYYCYSGNRRDRAFKTPVCTQSVTSITYNAASDGSSTTLSSSNYTLETAWVSGKVDARIPHGRIVEAYNCNWPASRDEANSVTVRMVVGYGSPLYVPEEFKAAIKLLVGHWYEHREAGNEVTLSEIPLGIDRILGNLSAGEL